MIATQHRHMEREQWLLRGPAIGNCNKQISVWARKVKPKINRQRKLQFAGGHQLMGS